VKPTRSANNTDTTRRSAIGAGAAAGGARGSERVPASSRAPQLPQNLCPGGFGVAQEEHTSARALPQLPQNFCPAGFSARQLGHAATLEA
jgi:hypothetical protein